MEERRPAQRATEISRRKKLLFIACTVLLVLLVLEAGARVIELARNAMAGDVNPYVDIVNSVPVFELHESGNQDVYRRSPHHGMMSYQAEFAAEKPEGTFRIFLLGGSAAMSWPHDESGYSITALLERKLRQFAPHKRFEVLNTAGMTYASHRVKFVFDEVIEYDPDLILLYSGNNEFLENFVFRIRVLPHPWQDSALIRVIHAVSGRLREKSPPRQPIDIANYSYQDQISNRLSWYFAKASRFRRDPDQSRMVLEHYRYNVEYMVRQCKKRNVPVMLMNVPVNLKDWLPNVSAHRDDLTQSELARWQAAFRNGIFAKEAGDYPGAVAALLQAVEIDAEYAEAHYHLGVALQRTGQVEAAKESYIEALSKDAFPFRAVPQIQTMLFEIARAQEVPLIDIIEALERQADDGIMGYDVLVDYVHLTAESCEIIAHEVLLAMESAGLLPDSPPVPTSVDRSVTRSIGRTPPVLFRLFLNDLTQRQYYAMDNLYEEIIDHANRDARAGPEAAADIRAAISYFERIMREVTRYRELLRAEKLGILEENFTEQEAQTAQRDFVEMVYELEQGSVPREKFLAYVPSLEYRSRRASPSPPLAD